MNKALFQALDMLESEKGIPKAYMFEKLEAAFEEKGAGWEFIVSGYLHGIFGKVIEKGLQIN